jgi:hypothetical protein
MDRADGLFSSIVTRLQFLKTRSAPVLGVAKTFPFADSAKANAGAAANAAKKVRREITSGSAEASGYFFIPNPSEENQLLESANYVNQTYVS